MELNLGNKAATQQSWNREFAIRAVIREVQEEHPRASERRLVDFLVERLREDDKALFAAAEYAVKHALNAQQGYARMSRLRSEHPMTLEQRAEQRAKQKAEVLDAARHIANKVLWLNMEMPNGKRVRYCEGNYVASVCTKLAKAGKKAGNKLMGQAFSEESLREYIGA